MVVEKQVPMKKRVPTTVPLPLSLVKVLESKSQSEGSLSPEVVLEWNQLRLEFCETLQNMKRFASHPKLLELAETAEQGLQNLSQIIVQGTADEATSESFKFYYLLAKHGALREELRVTSLDSTDKLIHACKACQAKRLSPLELQSSIPPAIDEIDLIVGFFKNAADNLPTEIQQGFLQGIQSVQLGFSALQGIGPKETELLGAEDLEALQAAATNLHNGALILQELQEWARQAAMDDLSAIPAAGDFVKTLRQQISQHGAIPHELLLEWANEAFWVVQDRWAIDRHDLFMPRYKKDKLVESIDGLMLRLRDLHEYSPREQDEMLYLLEVKFEEVADNGFDLERLRSHSQGWLVDYLVAILAKGVPSSHIRKQSDDLLGTDLDNHGRLLREYLATDDRDFLLDALTELDREAEVNSQDVDFSRPN